MVLNLVHATQPRVEGGGLPPRSDTGMDQLVQQALETLRACGDAAGSASRWPGRGDHRRRGDPTLKGFEASARVYVDTKTVLRPLMRTSRSSPISTRPSALLARTLINRPNIELLIKKSQLETPGMTPLERDRLVETLLRDIKVMGVGRDNVFSFTYRDTSAVRAQQIVQDLVSLFLESDTSTKRRDAEAAREFIDEQVRSYEARLAEAEDRLKEFKVRNLAVSDASGKDYYTRMSTLTGNWSSSRWSCAPPAGR